jgi:hypothetical protein
MSWLKLLQVALKYMSEIFGKVSALLDKFLQNVKKDEPPK